MENKFDQLTDEEKIKFIEENISPLIRYGFQEALDKITNWIQLKEGGVIAKSDLIDKLLDLSNQNHSIDFKKLRAEGEKK